MTTKSSSRECGGSRRVSPRRSLSRPGFVVGIRPWMVRTAPVSDRWWPAGAQRDERSGEDPPHPAHHRRPATTGGARRGEQPVDREHHERRGHEHAAELEHAARLVGELRRNAKKKIVSSGEEVARCRRQHRARGRRRAPLVDLQRAVLAQRAHRHAAADRRCRGASASGTRRRWRSSMRRGAGTRRRCAARSPRAGRGRDDARAGPREPRAQRVEHPDARGHADHQRRHEELRAHAADPPTHPLPVGCRVHEPPPGTPSAQRLRPRLHWSCWCAARSARAGRDRRGEPAPGGLARGARARRGALPPLPALRLVAPAPPAGRARPRVAAGPRRDRGCRSRAPAARQGRAARDRRQPRLPLPRSPRCRSSASRWRRVATTSRDR